MSRWSTVQFGAKFLTRAPSGSTDLRFGLKGQGEPVEALIALYA